MKISKGYLVENSHLIPYNMGKEGGPVHEEPTCK